MLKKIFGRLTYKNRKFYDDDFDWENYTADSYRRRISSDIEPQFSTSLEGNQFRFDSQNGTVSGLGKELHPNVQLILEAIGQLGPQSLHEVGCGGGDHVANAKTLFPEIQVTGGDRGASQLAMALERHPELEGKIGLQDITMPFTNQWPQVDLVYSQAVLMHIHTAVSHFVALSNLTRIARKYILLVENVQCHNFVADLSALHAGGHLAWKSLFLYYLEGSTGARGILLSNEKLSYPELLSDEQLRVGVKFSKRRILRSAEDSARGSFGFQQ